MIKKSFIGFMVLSILNLIGCYSFQSVSPELMNESISADGGDAIKLMTKEYIDYRFDRYSYRVENDSIKGNGFVLQINEEVPFNGKIAFEDIINLNVEKLDAVASFGLAFGVAIIGLILVFVIEINKEFN